MKRIIAMIRPVMRDRVVAALHRMEDFPGAAMSEISSVRRGLHQHREEYREPPALDFPLFVRLEIVCADAMAPLLVETIRIHARTGRPGDGKIFVAPVEAALRIASGETDEEAL